MVTNESFINLNNSFYSRCRSKARIFNLLTVPSIIFILVILAYFKYIPLKVELHSVILVGFIYFIYLFFVPHNAYYVSCKFKSQYKDLVQNLKNYINNNTLKLGETIKANGSVDDFLKEFTSNLRNTNFSSVASGIFPTLGILGTFISIALSMPDFSTGTSASLEKEISLLLGGVGTAFYVSIYGIFLSIWWVFFEKIGMSRFEHDAFTIKEHTKAFFWSKLDIESIHIKNSLDNFAKMTNIFEQLSSKDVLDNIQNSIEQRVNLLEDILTKEHALAKTLDTNINSSKELFDLIKNMHQDINNNITSLTEKELEHKKISKLLNTNIENLEKSLSSISPKNLEKIYENIVKSIETMQNEMDRIGWRFNKELDDYDTKFNNSLKNSLEEIDNQTVKIIKELKEFKELSK